MKKNILPYLLLLCLLPFLSFAGDPNETAAESGGAYPFEENDADHPCISPEEYKMMDHLCAANLKMLGMDDQTFLTSSTTSLSWPIKAAAGLTDCGYHFIGAYVDQNTTASAIQDFNCGTNTYDGHQGTDIAAWPYGFLKMENNQVEVIAAAPGIIVVKGDGNYDRNCATTSASANYVLIQHADGSQALYWHMKKNSVTSKIVGQSVVAGEYLGIVGSSGSSSGPHLHFEVRTGTLSNTYKDPFSGSCNTLNASSWWSAQKPHTDPTVIKVSTNTTDIVFPACPTTETPNESSSFTIPFQGPGLPAGYAKFYVFFRDAVNGTAAEVSILNPNGSVYLSWTYNITATNKAFVYGWSKKLPTVAGKYTFKAIYNGKTCSTTFDIATLSGIAAKSNLPQVQVYPNPAKGMVQIAGDDLENGLYILRLHNVVGHELMINEVKITSHHLENSIDLSGLPGGIYFLTVASDKARAVIKIMRQ